MLRKFGFVIVLSCILLLPSVSQASVPGFSLTNYSEFVIDNFPVTNSTVANAGDYNLYMTSLDGSDTWNASVNFFGVKAGVDTSSFEAFIHAGLYVRNGQVHWFAAGDPENENAPVVTCLRGNQDWFTPSGRHTGCLSNAGDLGLDFGIWTRVQLVTYGTGKWIVRFTDASGVKYDVAEIFNPYTNLTHASVVAEESWSGFSPSDNPWEDMAFYDTDLKYRDNGWAHWPSNIGGNYSIAYISEASLSGADVCPDHYGVTNYIQGNPYLWYMGTDGIKCSGTLYTGGGPDTVTTSIVGETTGKFMSSENGTKCIYTNRNIPGSWEEWHVEDLGGNVVAYKGNNAKYIKRRSNDDLWAEATSTSSNNTQFYYEEVASYVFKLRNKANNRYVDHNSGSSCTEADTVNPGSEEKFRYVSW